MNSLEAALGTPLEDFWRTFAALGIAFETFVGLWALWVDLERSCKVAGEFLARFSTSGVIFTEMYMICFCYFWPVLQNLSKCCGVVGGWGVE